MYPGAQAIKIPTCLLRGVEEAGNRSGETMNELWEAWALTLDNPDWAESVRQELEFLTPSSALDLLLHRLSQGPQLYGWWDQLRDQLRSSRGQAGPLLERGLTYLTPDPDFVRHWSDVQQHSAKYRSRASHVQVDAGLFRSPQPRLTALEHLKSQHGLTGVVNLREESQDSQALCAQAGLDYHWIPVEDMQVPRVEQVQEFLERVTSGVTLVHCWAGQGRTGLFVACYRIARGWEVTAAIEGTDQEIYSRGMREGQREWVRHWASAIL